jgi:hypothetical protein
VDLPGCRWNSTRLRGNLGGLTAPRRRFLEPTR